MKKTNLNTHKMSICNSDSLRLDTLKPNHTACFLCPEMYDLHSILRIKGNHNLFKLSVKFSLKSNNVTLPFLIPFMLLNKWEDGPLTHVNQYQHFQIVSVTLPTNVSDKISRYIRSAMDKLKRR